MSIAEEKHDLKAKEKNAIIVRCMLNLVLKKNLRLSVNFNVSGDMFAFQALAFILTFIAVG